jgi:hypothetical protein
MPKADPIHRSDELFGAQLKLFKTAIGGYAAGLELSAIQVATQAADSDFFNYVLLRQRMMLNGGQQWTGFKDALRRGSTTAASTMPADPVFPAAVPPVPFGIEARFRALVRQIKAHSNYNEAMGRALGIEGAERTAPDLAAVQPEFDAVVSGEAVQVNWGWGGNVDYLDMIELRVDRSDGQGAVFLANDTTPGYVDSTPFPATPTKWTYTAIFWLNDRPVGQWSKPVSVTVGG